MKFSSFAVAAIIACAAFPAAAGHHMVTMEEASQFKIGVATFDEVTARLGQPQVVTTESDGDRTITYSSIHTSVKAATFVPIVGLFAGGAKAQTSTVTFAFGPDGLLKKSSIGNTTVACSTLGGCN